MRELRIKFNRAVPDDAINEFISLLSNWYDVIISDRYDYYIAMETIYSDRKAMQDLIQSDDDAIRIMFCGEAVYPDLNLFDYAVFYWGYYQSLDRIITRPYIFSLEGRLFDSIDEFDNSKSNLDAERVLRSKKKFCNFIYSNPNAHYMRDKLFYAISEYKQVDSLGRHLKNVEIVDSRNDNDWARKSVKLKEPYKFSIAVENSNFPGYTTEKLVTSMLANTIPLYFGNPKVGDIYNKKSFVFFNDYNSIEDFVDRVREIDESDQLYCDIMSEQWRTEKQIKACESNQKSFIEEMRNLFDRDKVKAQRRPLGTWGDIIYPRFAGAEDITIKRIVLDKIKK